MDDGVRSDDELEVRVQAIGPLGEGRWLGRGRTASGEPVTFVTDTAAAERIADAMSAGDEPLARISRHQLV